MLLLPTAEERARALSSLLPSTGLRNFFKKNFLQALCFCKEYFFASAVLVTMSEIIIMIVCDHGSV
jgi:hypothetical protein